MAFVQLVSRLDDLSEYIRTISVASDIGIQILGNASQSASHFQVADSAATTLHLDVNSSGDTGIGAAASTANLEITRTRTDTSGTRRGIYVNLTVSPAADSSISFRPMEILTSLTGSINYTGSQFGLAISHTYSGGGTLGTMFANSTSANSTGGGTVTNLIGGDYNSVLKTVAGTVTTATAIQCKVTNSISGGTITTGTSLLVQAPVVGAGAAITTQRGIIIGNQGATGITTSYGMYIQNQTGATTPYSIYVEGGQSVFIAASTAQIPIAIVGASGQASNLTNWKDNNAKVNAFISPIYAAAFKARDAVTNAITTALTVGHNSSGTPTTAYGAQIQYVLQSSTTEDQAAAEESVEWATATHASRKARLKINVYDTAARECLRAEASGTAPMIGFLGAAAVIRTAAYTVTNPTTDRALNVTADTLAQGLQVLGTLISDLQGFGLLG